MKELLQNIKQRIRVAKQYQQTSKLLLNFTQTPKIVHLSPNKAKEPQTQVKPKSRMEGSQENKSWSDISLHQLLSLTQTPKKKANLGPKNKMTQKLIQISNSTLKEIQKIKVIHICDQTQKHFLNLIPTPKKVYSCSKKQTINFLNTHGRSLSCHPRRSCFVTEALIKDFGLYLLRSNNTYFITTFVFNIVLSCFVGNFPGCI